MEDMETWERVMLYATLIGLPWIFIGVGGWLVWSARRFMRRAIRTRGRVLHVTSRVSTSTSNGNTSTSVTYQPKFEYTDADGRTQQAQTFLSSSSYNFAIGSEHDILIDPQGGSVRMPGFWVYGFGAIFAAFGLIFAVVGIVVFLII